MHRREEEEVERQHARHRATDRIDHSEGDGDCHDREHVENAEAEVGRDRA